MAKFGLFDPVHSKPTQEYDGDYMVSEGEFVKIYVQPRSDSESGRQVAAIRLEKGYSVREI